MLRYIFLSTLLFSIQVNSDIFLSSPKIKLNSQDQRIIELKIENVNVSDSDNDSNYDVEVSDKKDDNNLSDEILKLEELNKKGILTDEEFEKAKKKLLD